MQPISFDRAVVNCRRLSTLVAACLAVAALLTGARAAGWAEVVPAVSPGAMLGFAVLQGTTWLVALMHWSLRSHALAVEHGHIPARSAHWAVAGWIVPVAQFVVPFAMLRARWRFYGVDARRVLRWLQVLFVAAVAAWGWCFATLRDPLAQRALPLALSVSALFVWRLRSVVAALSAAQLALPAAAEA